MIRNDEIEKAEKLFSTVEKAQEMWNAFKHDEPMLYSRMINHARSITTEVQKIIGVNHNALALIHNGVCAGYTLAFSILKKKRDDIFEKVSKDDQFALFLNGRAPKKFYSYSIEGLSPESDLFRAKQSYERYCLEGVRKALIPIIAEDIGKGHAPDDLLKKVEENLSARK